MRASELKIGQKAKIEKISETSANKKERLRLLELGFVRGTEISVVRRAPFGDPIELSLRGYNIALRCADAAMIEVKSI
ncbi:MAG: ferrous iron transport protein A [Clostridiales bacterium]|nr:ferrous iron transport protein A [Clostridiales bacterium]